MLRFLGRACARHHWLVLGIWLFAVAASSVAANQWGGETVNNFSVPGSDSEDALDILAEDFPQLAGTSATVVWSTETGQNMDDFTDDIQQTVANLATIEGVASVSDPTASSTLLLNSQSSPNGTIFYSTVLFPDSADDLPENTFDQVVAASQNSVDAGLNVQFGGNLVDTLNPPTSTISDYADEIGLAVALVLLFLVFKSVFIAVLPIVNAVLGVAFIGGLVALLETQVTIPDVGATLGTMLGLGVGVDYSLFILTRAYGELQKGADPVEAMGRALSTAGRAVLFAGLTICLATVALLLVGIPLISQMGLTAAFYVAIMVLAAITLVPALGGAVGMKLLDWHWGNPVQMSQPASTGLFAGLARTVVKHPVLVGLAAVVVMGTLASPIRDLQTGWVGDDADPAEMTQKQAYDLLAFGLGPGVNGELIVVAESPDANAADFSELAADATNLQQALAATPGVQTVSPPLPNNTDDPSASTSFVIQVQPTTGPDDPETSDLVRTIRSDTLPTALGSTALDGNAHVGGLTATIIDLDSTIADKLPSFMAVVLGGAFLLLLVVFRSVLIGVKAVFMNLLTVFATFGVLVAVFQWGWGSGLIGMNMDVDIVSFVPLLVFAILFGLSMDYEVFLMSSMQEAYLHSKDPREAVARSLGISGRVIMSAALVMFAVFVSFVSNPSPMVKQIGMGLAVGVFVDAIIVRLVLVPSLMRLFGNAGWWVPRWLDKIMPNISIEGGEPDDDDAATDAAETPATA